MNLAALDLNLLVALEALLEEGAVGRAADRVSLSQPAMSHALKRLRTSLGDQLLVRVGPRMKLTARGLALRYPVKDALARVRDLLASPSFDPATSTRTFRVFVADNACDLILPSLLATLRKQAPGVSIRIHPSHGPRMDSAELGGAVDLAVACIPNSFKGFYQQRLFTDRDACAMRRRNPVGARIGRVDEFLKAKHVAVVGQGFFEDPVDTWLRQEGFQRNVALTVPHYLQALHVVARSDLVAVIPERLIRAFAVGLDVAALGVPLDVGTFDEYLLHSPQSHADPGCVWLRKVFHEIAKSLGPLDLPQTHGRPHSDARKKKSRIAGRIR